MPDPTTAVREHLTAALAALAQVPAPGLCVACLTDATDDVTYAEDGTVAARLVRDGHGRPLLSLRFHPDTGQLAETVTHGPAAVRPHH